MGREPPLWVRVLPGMGVTPIPVSSTGQALTFPRQGGREKMDSGFRRNDGLGLGGREKMDSGPRVGARGQAFRRNDGLGLGGRDWNGRKWMGAL